MSAFTHSSIDIAASPDEVMGVIADFGSYPEWVDSMKSATVLSTLSDGRAEHVRLVLHHPMIKDEYTLSYDWNEKKAVTWRLVEGSVFRAMDGTYELVPKGDGTLVTYRLRFAINLPVVGALRRRAEKSIVESALRGLKQRAEAS